MLTYSPAFYNTLRHLLCLNNAKYLVGNRKLKPFTSSNITVDCYHCNESKPHSFILCQPIYIYPVYYGLSMGGSCISLTENFPLEKFIKVQKQKVLFFRCCC